MNVSHVIVGPYFFHYSFDGDMSSLTISAPPDGTGAMMLAWTPEGKARAIRIVSDPKYDVQMQQEATIAEFPVLHVVSEIRRNTHAFGKTDRRMILGILEEIAATS